MTYLVDITWMGMKRPQAIKFLEDNLDARFAPCTTFAGELWAGGRDSVNVWKWRSGLELTMRDALTWGRLARQLRTTGDKVGANDLWIAAHAIENDMPVLTRNPGDFERIPGVSV